MNLGSMSQSSSSYATDEAQKKFAGAKSISSDMFFDQGANGGPDANVNRFQGSSSISSAEYFGREETRPSRIWEFLKHYFSSWLEILLEFIGGSNYSNINTPDMDEVKESVKQGVSKVAGRLSNMASGVMNQLQVNIFDLENPPDLCLDMFDFAIRRLKSNLWNSNLSKGFYSKAKENEFSNFLTRPEWAAQQNLLTRRDPWVRGHWFKVFFSQLHIPKCFKFRHNVCYFWTVGLGIK